MTSQSPPRAGGLDDGTAEGRVYTVSGQDWDQLVAAADQAADTPGTGHMVVNMGPQHPSTHGVLRLVLELDGETVTQIRPVIGYLHTGIEKNLEYRTWTQGVTFVTRADYLMPIFNETAYCLAVERLLRIEDRIPERASVIRVLLMELNRISSHLGDRLPLQGQDQAQHPVGGRVLRAHVDDDLLVLRPVGVARDDLVPVLPGHVVDAPLGGVSVRVARARGRVRGHAYHLLSSGGGTFVPRYSTGMPPSG